jgi:uncharacterized protein YecT (DUF1311 family)
MKYIILTILIFIKSLYAHDIPCMDKNDLAMVDLGDCLTDNLNHWEGKMEHEFKSLMYKIDKETEILSYEDYGKEWKTVEKKTQKLAVDFMNAECEAKTYASMSFSSGRGMIKVGCMTDEVKKRIIVLKKRVH